MNKFILFYYREFLILILFVFFSFCNKTTLNFTKDKIEEPSYESKSESYLVGYFEIGKIEEWICPNGSHNKLVIERGLIDTIIHFTVGGVFTTRSNIVYCSQSLEVTEVEL